MGLNRGKLPAILWDRISKGEEKTTSQWAKVLGVSKDMITSATGRLRKKGYMIYPVGTVLDPFNGSEEGILRNVMDSKKYAAEIIHRGQKIEVPPRIKSAMRLMEETIIEFPELSEEIETYAANIMLMAVHGKEELKKIKNNPEDYENRRDTTDKDQAGSKPA